MLTAKDAIIYNFRETRRRSILCWRAIPKEMLDWKPDGEAMSIGEMIRHVWTATYWYQRILMNRGSLQAEESGPFDSIPVTAAETEIELSEPYFQDFLTYVSGLAEEDISAAVIDRSDVGYRRTLGDMLLRIAYHESVHTGQLLQYMRMAGLDRPKVWD
ncbi:hypothetical protein SD70_17500 [Gordoniibacillus kamchatkensis]|uniref:DinB-like domain-containing protein n=1 Tax=Gordoniibacillus kamchatkensis TaxID=1590651 RepID=A0ABR5AFM9_9BACL|nr:DinB family protein [Paenibacillus sp. VKM B-2647]KIL39856.1 hypothetical protein SD70_17500 [Paenibacillus sp. VKM B-2647]